MPLDLADALYAHLLDRFPDDRAYSRGALFAEGMPPLVATVLGRTLDRWLEHKLDQLESAWFDFEDPAVRAARAELVTALGRTARVPAAAWAETLDYAVSLVVRYLVTPARALTDATFEGDAEPLPAAVVRARLRTFASYPYLAEIAEAYLDERRPETLDPDALFALLTRVDRRFTEGFGPEEWLRLLGPLFKLARFVPGLDGVPTGALAQFFDAKGRERLADRLRADDAEVLDEAALHTILQQHVRPAPVPPRPEAPAAAGPVRPTAERPAEPPKAERAPAKPDDEALAPPPEAPSPEPTGPAEKPDDDRKADPEEALAEAPEAPPAPVPPVAASGGPPPTLVAPPEPPAPGADAPEPLWKRFARPAGGPTTETSVPRDAARAPAPPPPPVAPAPSPPSASEAEPEKPLWRRFLQSVRPETEPDDEDERPVGSPHAPVPRADADLDALEEQVLGRASEARRRRFVAQLFDGDEAAYAELLRRLVHVGTWSEASQVVARDCFRAYEVDIYSGAAVEFTNAVQKRYAA